MGDGRLTLKEQGWLFDLLRRNDKNSLWKEEVCMVNSGGQMFVLTSDSKLWRNISAVLELKPFLTLQSTCTDRHFVVQAFLLSIEKIHCSLNKGKSFLSYFAESTVLNVGEIFSITFVYRTHNCAIEIRTFFLWKAVQYFDQAAFCVTAVL